MSTPSLLPLSKSGCQGGSDPKQQKPCVRGDERAASQASEVLLDELHGFVPMVGVEEPRHALSSRGRAASNHRMVASLPEKGSRARHLLLSWRASDWEDTTTLERLRRLTAGRIRNRRGGSGRRLTCSSIRARRRGDEAGRGRGWRRVEGGAQRQGHR